MHEALGAEPLLAAVGPVEAALEVEHTNWALRAHMIVHGAHQAVSRLHGGRTRNMAGARPHVWPRWCWHGEYLLEVIALVVLSTEKGRDSALDDEPAKHSVVPCDTSGERGDVS